ncbi:hypothetical protein TeGR_g52, partial [Tetraparma gracilis]
EVYELEAPDFDYTLPFGEGLEATVTVTFMLDGEVIEGGKVDLTVLPPPKATADPTMMYAIAGVAGFLLIIAGVYIRQAQEKVVAQEKEIKVVHASQKRLQSINVELKENLKRSRHSDEELALMMNAMNDQKDERKDELRNVLIDSSEVKLKQMLGQGGMGTVHLGEYRGDQVAVKQLITINEESIGRFRFECFLTKELSHPHVVILVGVCWDEHMLGLILEFVDGGSLQSRLNQDWSVGHEGGIGDRITWKRELLKWATEAALGCQYLHHKRYFDEYEDEWKESVVHRDLKPDNMLVTSKSVLKLTDFGEARSAELDLTMTAVGTPIFICPEIIRSERYDTKADSYSYGICLVAMMQIEKTVQDFFFNAVMRQMGKTKRQGIGLGHLNRNIELGWRPTLPQEFYPSMIALIWRCWDDDPNVRPDFDEITQLLMGPIADEVRSNQEPVFGSGMLIKQMDQREMDLADDGSGVVAKNLYDAVMRQLKERDEELARLQGKGDMETYSAVTRKEGGEGGGRGLG